LRLFRHDPQADRRRFARQDWRRDFLNALGELPYFGGIALPQPANRFVDFDGDMSARAGDGANVLERFTQ
jgi:hypothetical protein